jgi:hypothetical protein
LEQAADGADARCDPIGGRQANPEDDALGPAAALGRTPVLDVVFREKEPVFRAVALVEVLAKAQRREIAESPDRDYPMSTASIADSCTAAKSILIDLYVGFGSMLLKKAKINRSNFFPVGPSKPVFRNQTRHSDLAKVAG